MNDEIRHALETIASRGTDPGAAEVWQQAFGAAPQRRRRGHRVRMAVAAAAAALIFAVVGVAFRTGPSDSHHLVVATPTTAPSPAGTPLRPFTVLDRIVDGRPFVRQVATDTNGGLWFMYGQTLKHVDAAGSITVAPLPKGFTVIQDAVSTQLVVDPDGTAWLLGVTNIPAAKPSTTLVEVKLGASSAKLIPLGQLPDNAAAEGFRPPELHGLHSPAALASDGAGHVALALDATSVVRVYDAENGTFNDVQLPKATDASSLRYFRDGKLAIGLVRYGDGKPAITAVIASTDGSLSLSDRRRRLLARKSV